MELMENTLGKAMVIAKSLLSVRASRPNRDFILFIALASFEAKTWSILSMIALMLEMQSDGPYF